MSAVARTRGAAAATSVAVFVSGAVLLGLELAASRVLAPYFGSSLYVWGALIGVVLAGLAAGYYAGGAAADRWPTPLLLVGAVGGGALMILAVPFASEPVLGWIVDWDPGPRLDPLLATIALFGLPSVVLGSVSPIAVRLAARSLERLGHTAGRLFALSTAGSIAGTFATAFWLIPALGTDQLLAAGATVLLVAAAVVALVERLALVAAVAFGLSGLGLLAVAQVAPDASATLGGTAARNWSPVYRLQARSAGAQGSDPGAALRAQGLDVVFARDTQYHRLVVADDGTTRYLRFDSSYQSAMYLDDPFRTRFTYTDYLALGLAYAPSARRVLFVGLGGGSAPKRLWRDFPSLRLSVAELDPVVVDVAYRYFALPRDPRIDVTVQDGRRYLAARPDARWDVIVLDAYYADSIPFHLATREFVQLARQRLRPGGVVVVNVIGALTGPQSRLFRSFVRTYRTVFPTVAAHPVNEGGDDDPSSIRNIILVATDGALPGEAFLADRWAQIRRRSPGAPDLTRAIRDRWNGPLPTADVPVLTDDYAPTDALLLVYQ